MFDLDGSGSIDENELAAVLLNLGRDASPTAVKRMLSELDTDGDGSVSEDEFIQLLEVEWHTAVACGVRYALSSICVTLPTDDQARRE